MEKTLSYNYCICTVSFILTHLEVAVDDLVPGVIPHADKTDDPLLVIAETEGRIPVLTRGIGPVPVMERDLYLPTMIAILAVLENFLHRSGPSPIVYTVAVNFYVSIIICTLCVATVFTYAKL